MKVSKIDFLEKFVIVTFPFAIAVGCTTTAVQPSKLSLPDDPSVVQELSVAPSSNQWMSQKEFDDISGDALRQPNRPVSNNVQNDQGEANMLLKTSSSVADAGDTLSMSEEILSETGDQDLAEINVSSTAPQPTHFPEEGILYFDVNKHEVALSDVESVKQHANYLQHHANLVLYVDGFSDNRGPAHFNYLLSKKRAQQVANLLIEHGAPESRIKVNGYGGSFPLTRETNWDENRRVELEYVNIGTTNDLFADLK